MPNITLNDIYVYAGQENYQFARNRDRWRFLLESFEGGEVYRRGEHLTRYALETAAEYQQRLWATPLDNHCRSVINVYVSFLFREGPKRDLGSISGQPDVDSFLRDADLDGRSLNAFMKEVSTWASVFGHAWIIMSKPTVEATTLADQQALGVRPYVNLLTPMVVTDWNWTRTQTGHYVLDYFKYVEDVNDSIITIKEWTPETIKTYIVDDQKKEGRLHTEEINGLGRIPAVLVYNQRSQVRGIGIGDIGDIADQQRAIYNELSEVEQSIRLEGHPSLVATPDTQMGSGAGALILIPENIDPGLVPYVLKVDSTPVTTIYESIKNRVESIDRMANTGTVRATETRDISGVAMKTEFQLLNARLSEKADNLELAEEQMWQLWCAYQAQTWDGEIHYPDNFDIRDEKSEFEHLKIAKEAATSTAVAAVIDYKIMEALDEEPDEIMSALESFLDPVPNIERVVETAVASEMPENEHWMINPATGETEEVEDPLVHQALLARGWRDV